MTKSGLNIRTDHCLNCDQKLKEHEHFCPQCGQRVLPEKLTLKYFVQEFLSNYFSFDSKFFNTVKPLVFKPAFLSVEFIAGRRIRYINPIQLFVFSSFLFFLVNSIMVLKEDTDQGFVTMTDGEQGKVRVDSVDIQKLDSLYIVNDGLETDTLDNSYVGEFLRKGQDFNSMDDAARNEKMSRTFSYAVFLLLPLFAAYLRLFFRRKDRHYLENIIFSLHYHSFYFVIGTLILLFDRLLPGDSDSLALIILAGIYLFLSVKRFYQFSWFSTILRFLGLVFVYGVSVSMILIVSIILTLFI